MREKYKLLRDIPGKGRAGDVITLHPREAAYLVAAGHLERYAEPAKATTKNVES